MKRWFVLLAAVVVALAACSSGNGRGAPNARGSAPAGQIVFERVYPSADVELPRGTFVANPDGTNEHRLPTGDFAGGSLGGIPIWSPDGTKLVIGWSSGPGQPLQFLAAIVRPDGSPITLLKPGKLVGSLELDCYAWSSDGTTLLCSVFDGHHPRREGIYSIRADGTGFTRLTATPYHDVSGPAGECGGGDYAGDYSPDGTQFVFVRHKCGTGPDPAADESAALYVENADGTDLRKITAYGSVVANVKAGGTARWSPDGSEILFMSEGTLYTVHPDGSGLAPIHVDVPCSAGCWAWYPDWSPDGKWIVFTVNDSGNQGNLYRSWPNGTHVTEITDTPKFTEQTVNWGSNPSEG